MNMYLIGYRGSGKTTLAKLLAAKLKREFLDTDTEIVSREKRAIPEIFSAEGEEYFRRIESEVLEKIAGTAGGKGVIVSTGGGIVLNPENRKRIRSSGHCIYLFADPETLYRRIGHDINRPRLTELPPMDEIRQMLEVRDPLYRETAEFVLDTGELRLDECVSKITNMKWWK